MTAEAAPSNYLSALAKPRPAKEIIDCLDSLIWRMRDLVENNAPDAPVEAFATIACVARARRLLVRIDAGKIKIVPTTKLDDGDWSE